MIQIIFSTRAKKDCLKGGFSINDLRKAVMEEMSGKIMDSLNDILYISVIYGERPIIAIGKQYDNLFLVEEVNFETTLILETEGDEPSIVYRPVNIESKTYLELKGIKDKKELIDSSIEKLDLSIGTYNRLFKAGIKSIGSIINKTEDYYKEKKILPNSNLKELKGKIFGLNLEFNKRTED